jgi:hypothetical protein
MPAPFDRLPEEQLLHARKRTHRLFDDAPTAALQTPAIARQLDHAISDLEQPSEVRELGLALFLDRPLGVFKRPAERDRTPFLSYEAYSDALARQRWDAWRRQAPEFGPFPGYQALGRSVAELDTHIRPGVISLADAALASPDFRLLRTTTSSLQSWLRDPRWLAGIDTQTAQWLQAGNDVLLIREPAGGLLLSAYEGSGAVRVRWRMLGEPRYTETGTDETLLNDFEVVSGSAATRGYTHTKIE